MCRGVGRGTRGILILTTARSCKQLLRGKGELPAPPGKAGVLNQDLGAETFAEGPRGFNKLKAFLPVSLVTYVSPRGFVHLFQLKELDAGLQLRQRDAAAAKITFHSRGLMVPKYPFLSFYA